MSTILSNTRTVNGRLLINVGLRHAENHLHFHSRTDWNCQLRFSKCAPTYSTRWPRDQPIYSGPSIIFKCHAVLVVLDNKSRTAIACDMSASANWRHQGTNRSEYYRPISLIHIDRFECRHARLDDGAATDNQTTRSCPDEEQVRPIITRCERGRLRS